MKLTIKKLAKKLLPREAKIRFYRQAGLRYLRSIPVPRAKDRPTVIVFNHFFDQDVHAMQYGEKTLNYVVVDAPRLFRGARLFFGEDVKCLLAPYDSEPLENRTAYRRECEVFFNLIQSRFSPSAIVLTADNFYWARELVALARERDVRVAVVDKEGVITPHYFTVGADRYKRYAPFMSDQIFVYSDRQRDYWQEAGVTPDHISVIGQLRSDLFFRERRREVDRLFPKVQPLVTFFSYEDDAYITMLQDGDRRTWSRMKRETHDTIFSMASAHPEFNFVIKTHPQQSDLPALKIRYDGLSNLAVVGGSSIGNELIQRSELIVAFQTTAVIEAMFMDRRVIYTCWDPHYDQFSPHILPFHDAPGIYVARTFAAFEAVCERFFKGDWSDFVLSGEEREQRTDFVDTYLFRPDGDTCKRFDRALGELIT